MPRLSSRELEAWTDRSITARLARSKQKYGICEGRSVNGSQGDLDAHEPFFDIIGLAVLGGFLCRGGVDCRTYCPHNHYSIMIMVLQT